MKFAVIGHPIAHSLSSVMHEANFSALERDDTYEALDIPPEQFDDIEDIIASRNLDGFNITIPHKERILPYLDDIDVQARDLGAVNTVKIVDGQWIGYNTDGIGYVKGLQAVYPDLANAYILILEQVEPAKALLMYSITLLNLNYLLLTVRCSVLIIGT